MFGKCCYWIASNMVGDYELGTSLRDVLFSYPHIVGDNGNRFEPRLCRLQASDMYDILEGILYRGDIDNKDKRFIEMAARFSIKPDIDVFDGVRVFCVSCDGLARLVFRHGEMANPQEAKVPIEIVESTLSYFLQALELIYEKAITEEETGLE